MELTDLEFRTRVSGDADLKRRRIDQQEQLAFERQLGVAGSGCALARVPWDRSPELVDIGSHPSNCQSIDSCTGGWLAT